MADDVLNIHGIVSSGETKDIRSGQGVAELSELANRVLLPRTYSLEACHRSLVRYQIHMMGSPFYRRGIHYPDHLNLEGMSPDVFDIQIVAGLNLPATKQAAAAERFRMFEAKAIDSEAILDNTDPYVLKDREEVKARMRAKEMQAQQMSDQQAQAEIGTQEAQAANQYASAYSNVVPMDQGG